MSTVCPLLWSHSFISTTGHVKPCCRSKDNHLSQDWHDANFEQGIMSAAHKTARQQMRQGEWPSACQICKEHEKEFGYSARTQYLEVYDIDYKNEPSYIESIDVKFNNKCNLACVMCNTESSSKINDFVQAHGKLCPSSMSTYKNIDWQEQKKLEWCKSVISQGHLKTLKTTGGEPFAQKHFWQLIDWCIETEQTNFEIKITTNGTKFNKKFLDKLSRFHSVQLCISCDGTHGVYDYIRYGSDWTSFTQKIKTLCEYVDRYETFSRPNLHCVLQAYNCHNIHDLYKFSVKHNLEFTIDCYLNPLDSSFNIESIPDKTRRKIIKKSKLADVDNKNIQKYVQRMQSARYNPIKAKKLAKDTNNLDILRKTNSNDLGFPIMLTKIG